MSSVLNEGPKIVTKDVLFISQLWRKGSSKLQELLTCEVLHIRWPLKFKNISYKTWVSWYATSWWTVLVSWRPLKATLNGLMGHNISMMTKLIIESKINPIPNFYIKKFLVNLYTRLYSYLPYMHSIINSIRYSDKVNWLNIYLSG